MPTQFSTGPTPSRGALWLVLIGGAVAVASLVVFLQLNKQVPPDRPPVDGGNEDDKSQQDPAQPIPVALSAEECQELLEWKNLALGHLENINLREAEPLLIKLAERLPADPGVARNLAVLRLARYRDLPTEDRRKVSIEPIESAIEAARKLEPASPTPHLLSATLSDARRAIEINSLAELEAQAEASLVEAVRLEPDNAPAWYALYALASISRRPELSAKALPALREVARLDPENSHVMVKMAVLQAKNRDPAIFQTLQAIRGWLPRLLQSPDRKGSFGAPEAIGRVETLLAADQWEQAERAMLGVSNLILGDEWEASDKRRIEKHPLNYIVLDFGRDLCPAPPAAAAVAPLANVRFRPLAAVGQIALPGVADLLLPDFDLDRRVDVLALAENRIAAFGRGETGEEWQSLATVETVPGMQGLLTADLDRDLLPKEKESDKCNEFSMDVVAYGDQGVQVFRNVAEIKESSPPSRSLVLVDLPPELQTLRDVLAAVLADVDHDGDLDLVLSSKSGLKIWANRGDATFFDITERSNLSPDDVRPTALAAADFDRDLDLDIVMAGPGQPAGYLENLRHGAFRWRKLEQGFESLNRGVSSLVLADLTGSASWDVIAGGSEQVNVVRTETLTPGRINPHGPAVQIPAAAEHLAMFDLDNDSYSDLVAWGGGKLNVLAGSAAGLAAAADNLFETAPANVAACAVADMDSDGDGEIVVANAAGVSILDNDGGNKNHWIDLRVRGKFDMQRGTGRINHYGIGATAELKSGAIYREQLIAGQVTHFGLGQINKPDVLRIIWTNGVPQVVMHPQPDMDICEVRKLTGSCPYLYTWNGEQFVFCTDTCWNAPLGLQPVEGVFAQPRAWEYLKVPGDRLVAKDGQYVIQITEELWEATYFDSVKLIAVDHPADVEIYTNEKVGPPEISQFKVHTVSQPREPAAARDKHGRDVSEVLRRADGDFFKGYDERKLMGYVDEHYLELDLGQLQKPSPRPSPGVPGEGAELQEPAPGAAGEGAELQEPSPRPSPGVPGEGVALQQITLFLTGWLWPTDTSLNVAISQNPNWEPRKPPAIHAPDANGEWREVRPFMGFPGGKTKTIAVDLAGVFTGNDYRLRIVTNFELYWDHVFFTVDEQPAEFRLTELTPASADLHYRGFSAVRDGVNHGPDFYDYATVSTFPKFAPMRGAFTRYGDITELLQTDDDRLAVLGSGDEMTVAFSVPVDGPPPGWKRDFLLYNNGWDKDAVLTTAYGQQVEPLPFQAMSGYPYRADESFPDTPLHRDYLMAYQTRFQDHVAFWRLIRNANDTSLWPTNADTQFRSFCGQHVRPKTARP